MTPSLPTGTEAKFNPTELLKADTQDRYESYKVAIEAGFLTVEEVRERENLLPLPEEPRAPELSELPKDPS